MEQGALKTEYPVLMLHGVGFRDLKWPMYWGRIAKTLTDHGVTIYFGQQDCWADVEENAKSIKARINRILDEANTEKVNIIAHFSICGGVYSRNTWHLYRFDFSLAG